jgi:hypothetical protein
MNETDDRIVWRALVNMMVYFRIPKSGNFLDSRAASHEGLCPMELRYLWIGLLLLTNHSAVKHQRGPMTAQSPAPSVSHLNDSRHFRNLFSRIQRP